MKVGPIASWPELYIPRLDKKLPPLALKDSEGSLVFDLPETFTMYVCGITPYDATHLGHAATYLTFDLINRYQSARGSKVRFVENITDIDEPLLERASRDNRNWQELAESQVDLFRGDMTALHVKPPQAFVPATGVMDLIDDAIKQMDHNGFVYRVENDLYFDISSFLTQLPIPFEEALSIFAERGGDPDRIGKRHPLDPVLWWANKNDEPGWESSHGFGRPGWHIECSVIALRYLIGEEYLTKKSVPYAINLQGGGSDLIFPHHFMSAAQAQAMLGIPFAQRFVHTGMVGLDGEKMSKSKGNLVFVSALLNAGVDPLVIRFALLKEHYRSDRMWTHAKLEIATAEVEVIKSALSRDLVTSTDRTIEAIIDSLAADLDTPAALTALLAWANGVDHEPSQKGAGELSRTIDALLGLAF